MQPMWKNINTVPQSATSGNHKTREIIMKYKNITNMTEKDFEAFKENPDKWFAALLSNSINQKQLMQMAANSTRPIVLHTNS